MTKQPATFEDTVRMRYKRSTAPAMRRFLTALKNEGDIVASVCEACSFTQVPPKDYCPDCGADVDTFEPVDHEGTLTSWTTVHEDPPKGPLEAPFHLGIVELDDADSGFLHAVQGEEHEIETGARVRARLSEDREGRITDIEAFEVIG